MLVLDYVFTLLFHCRGRKMGARGEMGEEEQQQQGRGGLVEIPTKGSVPSINTLQVSCYRSLGLCNKNLILEKH